MTGICVAISLEWADPVGFVFLYDRLTRAVGEATTTTSSSATPAVTVTSASATSTSSTTSSTSSSSSSSLSSTTIAIIVGVLVSVVGVAAILTAWFCWRKRKSAKRPVRAWPDEASSRKEDGTAAAEVPGAFIPVGNFAEAPAWEPPKEMSAPMGERAEMMGAEGQGKLNAHLYAVELPAESSGMESSVGVDKHRFA